MKTLKRFSIVVIALLFVATAIDCRGQRAVSNSDILGDADLLYAGRQVLEAFASQDAEKLTKWVHPQKGVRFSPYAFVDVEMDRVFSKAEITQFWKETKIYLWGYEDGTGDPIHLAPGRYCDRYILDRNFLHAYSININNDVTRGNINNNASAVYPQGARVEYYVEPKPGEGTPEFDWSALRLVFERLGKDWLLIAVIHDEWTT